MPDVRAPRPVRVEHRQAGRVLRAVERQPVQERDRAQALPEQAAVQERRGNQKRHVLAVAQRQAKAVLVQVVVAYVRVPHPPPRGRAAPEPGRVADAVSVPLRERPDRVAELDGRAPGPYVVRGRPDAAPSCLPQHPYDVVGAGKRLEHLGQARPAGPFRKRAQRERVVVCGVVLPQAPPRLQPWLGILL